MFWMCTSTSEWDHRKQLIFLTSDIISQYQRITVVCFSLLEPLWHSAWLFGDLLWSWLQTEQCCPYSCQRQGEVMRRGHATECICRMCWWSVIHRYMLDFLNVSWCFSQCFLIDWLILPADVRELAFHKTSVQALAKAAFPLKFPTS